MCLSVLMSSKLNSQVRGVLSIGFVKRAGSFGNLEKARPVELGEFRGELTAALNRGFSLIEVY